MAAEYILYLEFDDDFDDEYTRGSLWAVLYSIMYLSKHAATYKSVRNLTLYKLVGSHPLHQGQS